MRGQWHSHAQAARVVFWWSQRPILGSPNLDPVLTSTFGHQTLSAVCKSETWRVATLQLGRCGDSHSIRVGQNFLRGYSVGICLLILSDHFVGGIRTGFAKRRCRALQLACSYIKVLG